MMIFVCFCSARLSLVYRKYMYRTHQKKREYPFQPLMFILFLDLMFDIIRATTSLLGSLSDNLFGSLSTINYLSIRETHKITGRKELVGVAFEYFNLIKFSRCRRFSFLFSLFWQFSFCLFPHGVQITLISHSSSSREFFFAAQSQSSTFSARFSFLFLLKQICTVICWRWIR